jgi:transcriptional regulator with XRE-family HTH domain
MGILSIEVIRERLQDRVVEIVAEKTGIHANTIRAIKRGESEPSYRVLVALSEYLTDE